MKLYSKWHFYFDLFTSGKIKLKKPQCYILSWAFQKNLLLLKSIFVPIDVWLVFNPMPYSPHHPQGVQILHQLKGNLYVMVFKLGSCLMWDDQNKNVAFYRVVLYQINLMWIDHQHPLWSRWAADKTKHCKVNNFLMPINGSVTK